uniref:Protein kinase domain-containing protein n=1 Tax=Solanum lycopersicum TaxID=4081 RepID=A0A3Q7EB33_SOLLC
MLHQAPKRFFDENLTAKIEDFGTAKLLKKHQTQTTTRICGTKWYSFRLVQNHACNCEEWAYDFYKRDELHLLVGADEEALERYQEI